LVMLAMSRLASYAAPSDELVRAAECRERSGLPNVLSKLTAGAEVRIAYFHNDIDEICAHETLCPDLLTSLAIQRDDRPFDANKD